MNRFKSAVILAGGKSSRMGFDKQLLSINGRKLTDKLIITLKHEFDEIIVVSNSPEYYDGTGCVLTGDEFPGRGPLGGIHAGMKAASSRYAYLTACDMPNINLEYIRFMKSRLENEEADVCNSRRSWYNTGIQHSCEYWRISMINTYPVEISDTLSGKALAWEGDWKHAFSFIGNLGFEGVELLVDKPELVSAGEITDLLGKNSLKAVALGTGMIEKKYGLTLTDADIQNRQTAVEKTMNVINLAAELSAAVVIGRFRGRWKPLGALKRAEAYFRDALDRLVPYGAEKGVKILLEPQSELASDFINTIGEAQQWLDRYPAAGLTCDTFHMELTERSITEAFLQSEGHIGLVHISDSERLVPGKGSIDFGSVAEVLKEICYEGPCSIEVKQIPDPETVCREFNHFLHTYC